MPTDREPSWSTRGPVGATSFVARDAELAELTTLLSNPAVRLVTLTGPGGVGKTRLANQAIGALPPSVTRRTAFVSLAPVRDADLVIGTISRELGIREQPGIPDLEALARGIGDQPLMMLLDNLEQVVDVGPSIAWLLDQCANLTVFATSRVRLNLLREFQFEVQPLWLPHDTELASVDELSSTPAIALFVQRARQAQSTFALDRENQADVVAICQKLDGLPLAIELAASRLRVRLLARFARASISGSACLPTARAISLPVCVA